ncbi:rhodanese-like domain-containing protein [Brevibacillus antibioticus]|uniref:Rhodanese-like domain-containing protein n=1 Tax=Brevibacillus antibioticus TaxID=2570228 RepID=A0A4U2YBD0_9BACL|nr:rhodanese-like domain-containing protein [Brevibacillus antibioticus]TKI58060.1 rhodanese-like domain-containing protein [Brevibacillus antibioticus]
MSFTTILLLFGYAVIIWYIISRFLPVKGLENLKSDQFKKRVNQKSRVMLIDVREPHEYKAGHIPSAVNIPLSQLDQRAKEISSKNDILLYCRSGMRSKQAAKILKKQGIPQMAHLQGGFITWNGPTKKK